MKRIQKLPQLLLAVTTGLSLLTGCTRSVTWEEEVPLNTGETIVVKRSGTYTYKSAPGNPLDFGYGPEWRSTIEFTYKGKRYRHTDDAGLVLLAIGPDGVPNLIASAGSYEWQWKHKYYCVTPSYVQFRPDSTGQNWTWPEQIEQWLHGLPTNLIFGLVPLRASGKKFTPEDRAQANASVTVAFKEYKSIEPTFQHQNCMRKN